MASLIYFWTEFPGIPVTSRKVWMAIEEGRWRWRDSWPPEKTGGVTGASNPCCSNRKRAPSNLQNIQMSNTPRVSREGGVRDSLGQIQRWRLGQWHRLREGSNKTPWLGKHGKSNTVAERSAEAQEGSKYTRVRPRKKPNVDKDGRMCTAQVNSLVRRRRSQGRRHTIVLETSQCLQSPKNTQERPEMRSQKAHLSQRRGESSGLRWMRPRSGLCWMKIWTRCSKRFKQDQ